MLHVDDYIKESLMPGEEVLYRTKLHWGLIFWAVVSFIIAEAMLAGLALVVTIIFPVLGAAICLIPLLLFTGLVMVLIVIRPIMAIIEYFFTEVVITNKRVLAKKGVLHRRSIEILLSQLEGVSVDQPFFGRILGYGTVVLTGSGGTKQSFGSVNLPFELHKHILEQIEALKKP